MRNITFVILIVEMLFISEIHAADLLATIPWNSGEQEYTVAVYHQISDKTSSPYREIHFISDKNSSIQKFETQDGFVSAFTLGQAGGCLVTLWTSGVANHYQVFFAENNSVQQILDFYTRETPDLISAGVCHTFVLHDKNTRYKWDGKMFITE